MNVIRKYERDPKWGRGAPKSFSFTSDLANFAGNTLRQMTDFQNTGSGYVMREIVEILVTITGK